MFKLNSYHSSFRYFNTVKLAFSDERMRPIWEETNKLSTSLPRKLAVELYNIVYCFDLAVTLHTNDRKQLKSLEKVINAADELFTSLRELKQNYQTTILEEELNGMVGGFLEFYKNSKKELERFKKYVQQDWFKDDDFIPITRQHKSENAPAIFFMKKLCIFFKQETNEARYDFSSKITNLICGTCYSENDAIKHCSSLKIFDEKSS